MNGGVLLGHANGSMQLRPGNSWNEVQRLKGESTTEFFFFLFFIPSLSSPFSFSSPINENVQDYEPFKA